LNLCFQRVDVSLGPGGHGSTMMAAAVCARQGVRAENE
jgi:hypothetical protein